MTTPNAPDFLRALAALLEQHQATLGYSYEDRGVEIDVAGVEVAAVWCNDTASGAAELRAAADRLNAPTALVARCVACGTVRGLRLGRGEGQWRCQNAECT